MTSNPKTPRRESGTVKNLAEALGVSRRRVATLLSEGMPTSIPEALVWRGQSAAASHPSPAPAVSDHADDSPAELRRRRIALLKKQEEKLAIEIAVRRGELVERGAVFADSLKCYSMAKARLLVMPNSLPGQLAGQDESAISHILRTEIIAILTELSSASQPYEPLPEN